MSSIPDVVNLPAPVPRPEAASHSTLRAAQIGIFAIACGLIVANVSSSYVAATFGWRAAFCISAGMMLTLALVLLRVLPQRRPGTGLAYTQILRSLPRLVARTAVLRRRGFYQAMMFAAFNIFWV
jgi:predicted MFS family arabinose efflux permease